MGFETSLAPGQLQPAVSTQPIAFPLQSHLQGTSCLTMATFHLPGMPACLPPTWRKEKRDFHDVTAVCSPQACDVIDCMIWDSKVGEAGPSSSNITMATASKHFFVLFANSTRPVSPLSRTTAGIIMELSVKDSHTFLFIMAGFQ